MKRDSKIFLVLISAVLITSGCVENSESESNTSPISVNEFSITPNPAPGDQTARVQMELQNNGDSDAENAYATLFGPTFSSGEGQKRTWRTSDGGEVVPSDRTMDFRGLNSGTESSPAIPARDTLRFTTPNIDEGRINSYNFNARIQYDYRTTADTEIQVMSNERYQETGASQTSPEVENSDGPIQVEVQGTTPHVFYDTGTADDEICLTVTNEGTGDPFLVTTDNGVSPAEDGSGYDIDDSASDKVELRVEDVGNIEFDSQDSEGAVVVDMIGNEGYQCFDMRLEGLGQITDLEQTTEIPIEVIYGYEEETSTSVTVEGRDTGNSPSDDSDDEGDDEEEDSDEGDDDSEDDGPADTGPGPT